jgi:hypothetical protein
MAGGGRPRVRDGVHDVLATTGQYLSAMEIQGLCSQPWTYNAVTRAARLLVETGYATQEFEFRPVDNHVGYATVAVFRATTKEYVYSETAAERKAMENA